MTELAGFVRIERHFDAPLDTVWRFWTEADLFMQWYGPMGMSVPEASMDVTVGGTRRVTMQMDRPDRSMTMYFTGTYTEVTPKTRLVYTEAMCDADGTILSPAVMGMPDGTPEMTEVHVDLSEDGTGTRMVMRHIGVPAGSPGEGGWMQAFEKLAETMAA